MALSRAVLLGAALVASARAAVPYRPAPLTSSLELPATGISPVPTPAPQPLHRRDEATVYMASDNTCAFVSGYADAALTCGNGNTLCGYSLDASTYGYAGCCVATACQTFYTACLGFVDYYADGCDDDCEQTLICSQAAAPYCNTASISMSSNLAVFAFYCDPTSTYYIERAQTTYSGETDSRVYTMVLVDVDEDDEDDDSITTSSKSTSTTSNTRSSTQTSAGSASSGSAAATANSGSKTNIGAIVGGVVGGIAALAIIALLAFFLVRSKRKNAAQTPMSGGPTGGAGAGGAPPGYPPAQPQYAGTPAMAQMSPPPPFDAAMQKTDYAAAAVYPQPYSPQQPGQPGPPPQQQYAPVDRTSSTSPLAATAHLSQISGQSSYVPGPVSPQTPATASMATATASSGVPTTVHEAGSNVVGGASDNHRGQMHELA